MVNGSDSEVRGAALRSPRSQTGGSNRSSPSRSPIHHTHSPRVSVGTHSGSSSPSRTKPIKIHTPSQSSLATVTTVTSHSNSHVTSNSQDLKTEAMNATNANVCLSVNNVTMNGSDTRLIEDVEMLDGIMEEDNSVVTNGNSADGHYMNGDTFNDCDRDDNMEIDPPLSHKRQLCGGSQLAIEKMLQFGRELQAMSTKLKKDNGKNEANKKALQDAFSLLAYSDPWSSPVGAQLDPVRREPVCAALNSAILDSFGLPKQTPLELTIAQATECMKLMSKAGIGSCAFTSVSDYLH